MTFNIVALAHQMLIVTRELNLKKEVAIQQDMEVVGHVHHVRQGEVLVERVLQQL